MLILWTKFELERNWEYLQPMTSRPFKSIHSFLHKLLIPFTWNFLLIPFLVFGINFSQFLAIIDDLRSFPFSLFRHSSFYPSKLSFSVIRPFDYIPFFTHRRRFLNFWATNRWTLNVDWKKLKTTIVLLHQFISWVYLKWK